MQLKQIRKSKNLSVNKLADAAGMHRRTIEDIEKRNDCLVSTAIRLAEVLGVTLDQLCLDDEPQ